MVYALECIKLLFFCNTNILFRLLLLDNSLSIINQAAKLETTAEGTIKSIINIMLF